ncbi:MAG: hypothetical protein B6242_14150 [Anaerolineaceae bacterium 4572_78]|nr:MAG: hypothetical protein B6242_14150 [Anaerolineaceae bacterium 4572_78]
MDLETVEITVSIIGGIIGIMSGIIGVLIAAKKLKDVWIKPNELMPNYDIPDSSNTPQSPFNTITDKSMDLIIKFATGFAVLGVIIGGAWGALVKVNGTGVFGGFIGFAYIIYTIYFYGIKQDLINILIIVIIFTVTGITTGILSEIIVIQMSESIAESQVSSYDLNNPANDWLGISKPIKEEIVIIGTSIQSTVVTSLFIVPIGFLVTFLLKLPVVHGKYFGGSYDPFDSSGDVFYSLFASSIIPFLGAILGAIWVFVLNQTWGMFISFIVGTILGSFMGEIIGAGVAGFIGVLIG